MSKNPAQFYRLVPTSICKGSVADIVIFGENEMWTFDTPSSFFYKSLFTLAWL